MFAACSMSPAPRASGATWAALGKSLVVWGDHGGLRFPDDADRRLDNHASPNFLVHHHVDDTIRGKAGHKGIDTRTKLGACLALSGTKGAGRPDPLALLL